MCSVFVINYSIINQDYLLDVVGNGGVCALQAECKGLWAVGVP